MTRSPPDAVVTEPSLTLLPAPAAIVLATSMSIVVVGGRGATEGVLIKDAVLTLERQEKVDTVVVD